MKPSPQVLIEAKRHPNGWVYQIDGEFLPDEFIPPEAIVGAWKVDGLGNIAGEFIPNPRYKSHREATE